MIFKDLLNKVKWAEIEKGLKTLYGLENSAPYKGIFEKLLAEQPIVNENLKICVEKTEDGYDVFGLENNESLALELTSWKEWLGFSVCTADMSPSDFVAHALWEMTFYGSEEQMETTKKGLDEEARKIVNHEYTIIKEDCAFCKGTGRLEAEACSLCQGTGKMQIISFDDDDAQ